MNNPLALQSTEGQGLPTYYSPHFHFSADREERSSVVTVVSTSSLPAHDAGLARIAVNWTQGSGGEAVNLALDHSGAHNLIEINQMLYL